MRKVLKGKSLSPGLILSHSCKFQTVNNIPVPRKQLDADQVPQELKRFHFAVEEVITDLKRTAKEISAKLGAKEGEIFKAHIAILKDSTLIKKVERVIAEELFNSEFAVNKTFQHYRDVFEKTGNPYIQERIEDLKDLENQILSVLNDVDIKNYTVKSCRHCQVGSDRIVVMTSIPPSLIHKLIDFQVKGFVTEHMTYTSHAALMLKEMMIPGVTGIKDAERIFSCNRHVLVDGDKGIVVLEPNARDIRRYKAYLRRKDSPACLRPVTKCGRYVNLNANLETHAGIRFVKQYPFAAIGLVRTEFLFMDAEKKPSFATQVKFYRHIAEAFPKIPVNIRLLDVGGDKKPSYLEFLEEDNPLLGLRGVRYLLKNRSLLKTQIEAIIKSNTRGNLRIMVPMVTNISEFDEIKAMVKDIYTQAADGSNLKKPPDVGLMIEVPASVFIIPHLKGHADFISIGTNDLLQYLIAVDRNTTTMDDTYCYYHPALFHCLKLIADLAGAAKIPLSICGELPNESKLVGVIIGLGITEFSVDGSAYDEICKTLNQCDIKTCTDRAKKVLALNSSSAIMNYLGI